MPTTYFFADAGYLPPQSAGGRFGMSSFTDFRLCGIFNGIDGGATELRAYAVCKGSVMIQEVDGHDDLVNLIIRPEVQPNPLCTPVKYFVYRGLRKEHFLGSDEEVIDESSSETDFMIRLWEVRNQLNADKASADSSFIDENLSRGDLGLHELDDVPLDGAMSLDELFDTYVFQPVQAGTFLGMFGTTENYGFEILLDHKWYNHCLNDVRSLEHTLAIAYEPGQAQFPDSEDITTRHKREQILAYMSPAAWYGMLAQDGVSALRAGSSESIVGDDVYDLLKSKFDDCSKFYVDIRNHLNDSFNFFDDYASGTASVRLRDATGAVVAREYHDGNGWPILVLDASDFPATVDTKNKLEISLPKGENEQPMLVLAHACLFEDFPERKERYVPLSFDASPDWSNEVSLGLQNNSSASVIYPGIIQLHVGKRVDSSTFVPTTGTSTRPVKNSVFDNLMSPRPLAIPSSADRVAWRTFPDPLYVGWTSLNGADFMVRSGAARDPIGEVAFFFRDGVVEEMGAAAPTRACTDLALDAGDFPSPSFFHALQDELSLIRFQPLSIKTSDGTERTIVEVFSVNDYLTSDPFKQSADDLIMFVYTNEQREVIASVEATFWPEIAPTYTVINHAQESDVNGRLFFWITLGVQGLLVDEVDHSYSITILDTGLTFYSFDGIRYFTTEYAEALRDMIS